MILNMIPYERSLLMYVFTAKVDFRFAPCREGRHC